MGYGERVCNGPMLATCVQPMNAATPPFGRSGQTQIVRWAARERPAQY